MPPGNHEIPVLVTASCKQSILTKSLSFTICPASFFILCCTFREVLTAFHRNILRENTSVTMVEKERREFELVLERRELSFQHRQLLQDT